MNFKKVEELQRLIQKNAVDKIPNEFFTTEQYANHEGVTVRRASQRLKEIVKNMPDKIEIKKFKIKTGQTVRPVPHYRIK